MPVLDGWEFLRRRAKDATLSAIPVIIFSAEPVEAAPPNVVDEWLENALKFSPRDSTIVVSARVADDEVVFSVADQGPGIAPDEIPRIFEPYWSGRRNGQRSTGLGLFISKEIIAAHGGRLWAESRLGHGSVVSFAYRWHLEMREP